MSFNKRSSSKANKDSNAYLQKKYDSYSVAELERNLDVLNEVSIFSKKGFQSIRLKLENQQSWISPRCEGVRVYNQGSGQLIG